MKLPLLFTLFRKDLKIIEDEILKVSEVDSMILKETSNHLLSSGGKRIRPVFVLLCAKLGNYDIHKVKYAAAALELIHSASLAHDDVIDEAELRRGKPTISAKWDNKVAIYTGDYIFAHSISLIGKLDSPAAHKVVADTIVELCIGEVDQIEEKYDFDQPISKYYKRIERKTAILIAVSAQLGAIAAELSEEQQQKIYDFGYNIGMSFQIIDDILDFTGTEKELGKPAGSDLLHGNITLPVFYAMENPELKKLISTVTPETKPDELKVILDAIKSTDAIERSRIESDAYLNKAIKILDELPANKHKKNLYSITNYIGKRNN